MDAEDLRRILENSSNQLNVFADKDFFNKFDMTVDDFLDIIKEFLSDEEKLKLFEFEHFLKLKDEYKMRIIELISDEDVLVQILSNINILGMDKIENQTSKIYKMILALSDDLKREILGDKILVKEQLKLSDGSIVNFIRQLSNTDDENNKFIIQLLLKNYFSDRLNNLNLLSALSNKWILYFYKEHREFLNRNEIFLFQIIRDFDSEQQKEFAENIEETNLTEN